MVGSKTRAPRKKGRIASSTTAPAPSPAPESPASASAHSPPSPRRQQALVNIFADAFAHVLSSDRLPTLLQEIKQALYSRDFGRAFRNEEHLAAYAARWSPTRALCYASVLARIETHLEQLARREPCEPGASPDPRPTLRMLSIGGCAAEHVAFASCLGHTRRSGTLRLLDAAPWEHVASALQARLAADVALVDPSRLAMTFVRADVLCLGPEALAQHVGSAPSIVTLMFTLNELYAEGVIGKTTALLRHLGHVLPAGSLLLVVDSPGSYSEAALGRERKRRYPMQWLLNHTLLEAETPGYAWHRLESEDSTWFRLPEGLSYPIQLENMRYQMHLYRISKSQPVRSTSPSMGPGPE
ncbi:uncharacterized protein MAM_08352 [Metarhizium album ARSEF 1941]|uniref:25S rRNA (Uridine(2843)-N(3))-methyltransferase n=1 Tax=Metarhizium album (strain ARSEF 1941) TaxID=1081103 RepID=A0A0B2WIX7_METAS|nr:uncharacterized protein MAM_08352 [Metarhizium album ARSEF 1941]KHN93788.1 hypothetical protein MAM_08352 [Metarhizium album ARSEF 1941]